MPLAHITLLVLSTGLLGFSGVVVGQEAQQDAETAPSPHATSVGDTMEQVVPNPHLGIDAAVRAHMAERDVVGLAVGVVRSGAITYLKGYGYEDREAGVPLLAERSMLRWASIAKPITATIAARLVRAGQVDLSTAIDTYWKKYRSPRHYLVKCRKRAEEIKHGGKMLPCEKGYASAKLPRAERPVTLKGLLSHLSGIMGYGNGRRGATPSRKHLNNPRRNKGLAWGLHKVLRRPFATRPGTAYGYSTFGFNLAAVTLEQATGKDFPALIDEHVAGPADMRTLQPDYAWVDIPHRAAGYRKPSKKKDLVRTRTHDVS
ncbi:MAG: serine hydrolase domain-containing protein, partial [Myxococcota bacterium]|nr:serine hydrolase domain-containing protein [Myxococcota bacterium]